MRTLDRTIKKTKTYENGFSSAGIKNIAAFPFNWWSNLTKKVRFHISYDAIGTVLEESNPSG